MPLPPLKDVLDALQHAVLPGAGGAALVLCAFLLLGRWAGALGSTAAVALGFVWGNFTLTGLQGATPPTWANTWRLIPWSPAADEPGYKWLVQAGLVLVVCGLVSRWLGLLAARALPDRYWLGANVFVWAPRAGAVLAVSGWLVLGKAAEGPEWALLRWQVAGAMLVTWVALDGIARAGAGAQSAGYAGAALMTCAVVMLYAHSALFMELAVILGSAMFGVAAANALVRPGPTGTKADTSGAIPAAVVFLSGLALSARPSLAENKVPDACFWLAAFAPALLLPFLIPAVARKTGWWVAVLRAALVLVPLIVAVALTVTHETPAFEEKW
jgi:hypothetical protein